MANVYHSRQPSTVYGHNDYDRLLPNAAHDSDESLPLPKSSDRRRSRVILIGSLITISSIVALSLFFVVTRERQSRIVEESDVEPSTTSSPYNASRYIYGQPTESFKDNLYPIDKYITAWVGGGWTNDFMTYVNLIYLAAITDRIPILPPFVPTHVGGEAGFLDFGRVFDVPRLSEAIRRPILEWWQVKDPDSTVIDDLGCWSIWAMVNKQEHHPRINSLESLLGLDISYTPVPDYVKLFPQYPGDWHSSFWGLAAIVFPEMREQSLQPPFPSPIHNHTLPPDEQLVCFDFPYYVGAFNTFEFNYDYSPAWRFVGKYVHWTSEMENLGMDYLRRAFQTPPDEEVPPYIGIHIRRNDFAGWCRDVPREECFAPLSAYARRVEEIQEELLAKKGIHVARVLVMSDERDEAWWDEVREFGWTWIDHAAVQTEETYGKWYPVLLDAVFQSLATGLIGTEQSTMSLIGQRRVQDWHGGVVRTVKWGFLDADAH